MKIRNKVIAFWQKEVDKAVVAEDIAYGQFLDPQASTASRQEYRKALQYRDLIITTTRGIEDALLHSAKSRRAIS